MERGVSWQHDDDRLGGDRGQRRNRAQRSCGGLRDDGVVGCLRGLRLVPGLRRMHELRGLCRMRGLRRASVRVLALWRAGFVGRGGGEFGSVIHSSTVAPPLALADYHGPVSGRRVPGGVVHKLPTDLRKALIANATALDAWKDITPLARNEFICWVEDAKQASTRERRIRRTQEELEEGQRRPCCWPGCKHRERTGS